MLRLIQGEPCPRRRAEARAQRRAASLDPHDVRLWLRERSAGAVGDPSSEGARSLLARAEGEPATATVDGMPLDDLIALGVALEGAPSLSQSRSREGHPTTPKEGA